MRLFRNWLPRPAPSINFEECSERIESVIKERDVGRAKISGLLDAAERLLEHYSDGLPEHLTEEFRDAVINARKP